MRGSLEIIHFLLSCKGKWKANYGCVSTCLLRFCSTELICHPQSYWQLALSLSHFTYQMEMVKNLISLTGHLGWRPHLCNTEATSFPGKTRRTTASISVATTGRGSARKNEKPKISSTQLYLKIGIRVLIVLWPAEKLLPMTGTEQQKKKKKKS